MCGLRGEDTPCALEGVGTYCGLYCVGWIHVWIWKRYGHNNKCNAKHFG